MSKVLHHEDDDHDDAKAIAIPRVFSENSRAKITDSCQPDQSSTPDPGRNFSLSVISCHQLKKNSRQP